MEDQSIRDKLLWHNNVVYNQNPIDRWMKGCILLFSKKGYLGLAKNYRGITFTSISAKTYNALLRNRIEPKIENIGKTKMSSGGIDPWRHKFWLSIVFLKGYAQNTLRQQYYLSILPRLWFHSRMIDGANSTRLLHTKRNCCCHNDVL